MGVVVGYQAAKGRKGVSAQAVVSAAAERLVQTDIRRHAVCAGALASVCFYRAAGGGVWAVLGDDV